MRAQAHFFSPWEFWNAERSELQGSVNHWPDLLTKPIATKVFQTCCLRSAVNGAMLLLECHVHADMRVPLRHKTRGLGDLQSSCSARWH